MRIVCRIFIIKTLQIQTQGDGTPVHTIQTITEGGAQGEVVDLNSVAEATLNSEGQIILTAEDGHGKIDLKCVRVCVLISDILWGWL